MRTLLRTGRALSWVFRRRPTAAPLVCLLLLVATSVGAAAYWSSLKENEARQRFERVVLGSEHAVLGELHRYGDALKTTRGLFAASHEVEPEEFRQFARSLSLGERYAGAQGLAFLSRGSGEPRSQVFRIRERDAARSSAGFALPTDALTTAALARARDSGRPALGETFLVHGRTAPATAAPATSAWEFALYVPVYRNGASLLTAGARRSALLGWLGASFRGDVLVAGAARAGRGEVLVEPMLRPALGALARPAGSASDQPLTRTSRIGVYGHNWDLRFTAAPGFLTASDTREPLLALVGGLLLSLALSALVWVLTRSESRARRLVDEATATLREREERFRLLASSTPIGIYELDPAANNVYSNAKWHEISGRSFAESLGSGWIDAIDPLDRASVLATVHSSAERRDGSAEPLAEAAAHFRVRTPAGALRWIYLRAAPLRGDGGSLRGYVGSIEDVTARKEQEEALRGSEERYRGVVESTSEGVWMLDLQNVTTFTNRRLADILGWEVDEMLGRSLFEFVDPDDRRMLEHNAPRLRVALSDYHEFKLRRKDGSELWAGLAASPLTDGSGDHAGSLVVLSDITRRKQAEAQQAAVADLGQRALAGLGLQALLQDAVAVTADLLEVRYSSVLELLPDGEQLLLRAGAGWEDDVIGTATVPAGHGSQAGFGLVAGVPVIVRDLAQDSRFTPSRLLLERGVVAGMNVPILAEARSYGVLSAHTTRPRDFNADETNFLQSVANVLGAAIERDAAEERTRYKALHDPLTGLPNRALFLDRLEHGLARSRRWPSVLAVLFLDLDRFKLINDSMGHDCGDQLLITVAERLAGAIRPGDTVARLGGDEFTILCDDLEDADQAVEIATRVAEAVERPLRLEDSEVVMTTSVGIAIASDSDQRPAQLLRDADAAMYRAKGGGKARCEIFDEDMRVRTMERLTMESALRHAVERDELRLLYQPQIQLETGKIVGVEALVRWQHPERGTVSPLDFIPMAEEIGLIVPIGAWVLAEACEQLRRWRTDHPQLTLPVMAVNLSARQLTQPNMPQVVANALAEAQLEPAALCLEITESVLVSEAESVLATLNALKALGVRLAVDDFGTRYSSFSYLKRFPIDFLKVDRSFIERLDENAADRAIVAGIINMAHALHLEVIAEGVETSEQSSHLRMLGCDLAQGFYFARPRAHAALEELLTADAGWTAGGRHSLAQLESASSA